MSQQPPSVRRPPIYEEGWDPLRTGVTLIVYDRLKPSTADSVGLVSLEEGQAQTAELPGMKFGLSDLFFL